MSGKEGKAYRCIAPIWGCLLCRYITLSVFRAARDARWRYIRGELVGDLGCGEAATGSHENGHSVMKNQNVPPNDFV